MRCMMSAVSQVESFPTDAVVVSPAPAQSSLFQNYLDIVDGVHKIIDVAASILSVVVEYGGKGIKFTAVVLAYPVVFIIGGTGLLLWHGAKLAIAGSSRLIHSLDGALNRN